MPNSEFEKAIEQLRIEYIGNSLDRLDSMDLLLDNLIQEKGNRGDQFFQLQRDIHSLKGSASTFGFPLISTIAHRLEDYIEAGGRLDKKHFNDIQRFFDAIREFFENAKEPQADDAAEYLKQLPTYSSLKSAKNVAPASIVLIVMPKSTQRKIVSKEFIDRGYELAYADTSIEGIDQAT